MLPGQKQANRQLPALSRLSLALLVLVGAQLVLAPYVAAQEAPQRPRNVFEFLFGGGIRKAKPEKQAPVVKRTNRTKASNKAAVAPREPEVVAVEKAPTAKALLVVGDFNGNGLAEALATVYAAKADVRVVDRSNGSSGFVRDDFYNWPTEIIALLETEKPAAVVVMIGTNDRQEMRVAGAREQKRSENWTREYQARVTALAKAVRERGVPLVWVGLPSFKSTSMSSDMLAFNDIYRGAAEAAGGVFVDIWDGFVDENGAYVTTGPDINGQPVRLRSGENGINLTKAAKRKVAFYAEKPLEKILGIGQDPLIGSLGIPIVPGQALDPRKQAAVDRTVPISLTDPELDGGAELLGATVILGGHDGRTPAEKLAIEGIAPPASPGRADDFVPRPATAEAPQPAVDEKTTAIAN